MLYIRVSVRHIGNDPIDHFLMTLNRNIAVGEKLIMTWTKWV